MITPHLLPTARPTHLGLTFFTVADVSAATWRNEEGLMGGRDTVAYFKLRDLMQADRRTMQPDTLRRQYLVPLTRMAPGGPHRLRALHDGEDPTLITHYRVIWFAECHGI